MSRLFYLFFLFILIPFFSCSDNPTESIPLPPVPEQLNDGWEVSSLAAEGLEPERLTWLSEAIKSNEFGQIHSVLVVRNGKLVFEEYYRGYDVNRVHALASVTKSVVSLLVGIALDPGYIASIDDPIAPYFPEFAEIFTADTQKNALTIRHLLTMSSGLQWDEWTYAYNMPINSHYQMEHSSNWRQFVLEQPLISSPGTSFTYNSGNSILLGAILNDACEQQADSWAENVLFGPLGITTYQWYKYNKGFPQTGGGLSLRPRDMAKIGFIVLNDGQWDNHPIVSTYWLEQSIQPAMNVWPDVHYGFQWWLRPLPDMPEFKPEKNNIIYGLGYAGQFLFIIPRFDMVVVFTSWNENELANSPLGLLYEFIIRAVEQNTILARGE